ncbi:hypothetical protein Tco_1505573 [Tanacetum coccineum]
MRTRTMVKGGVIPKYNQKGNPKDKASVVKESDKAPVVVKEKTAVADKHKADVVNPSNVVADKAINVQDDPAKVVKENVLVVLKDKASDVLKNKGKKSSIGKDNRLSDIPKDKPKNNAPDVVKERRKTELPKEKPENNALDVVKEKSYPNPKQNIISSEILALRSNEKADSNSKLETDEIVSSSDEVDRKPKKLKLKGGLKRKRNVSDFNSSSIDEENIKRLLNKLTKKVKKEESDEESVSKKGKKKQKKLMPAEAAHEEYLLIFQTLRVRTSPNSLFFAIQDSRVDMLNFLSEIGFSSLHNVTIDKIPSKLGRFVVANFNAQTYMLSLDSGDKIEVTHRQIHEILGVPVGGYLLFDIEERLVDHEFVSLWVDQFYPKPLKDIRVNDIASKLVICLDVVRQLREDSVISNIDWCGYIYDRLQHSKLPLGTNHYLGPLTFLVLLYLDLSKFDGFPVVRIRPAIRNWSSYLMKQRQELELKDHVEENISLICQERVLLEEYIKKASLENHGDGKFLDLHEKYVKLFKNPISLDVDGNRDNDEDDGDDDAYDVDRNRDDEDGNLDDDVGNVYDVGNGYDCGNVSVGRNKAIQENETIQDNETIKDNETVQENETVEEQQDEEHLVIEEAVEENEILSTPETYT